MFTDTNQFTSKEHRCALNPYTILFYRSGFVLPNYLLKNRKTQNMSMKRATTSLSIFFHPYSAFSRTPEKVRIMLCLKRGMELMDLFMMSKLTTSTSLKLILLNNRIKTAICFHLFNGLIKIRNNFFRLRIHFANTYMQPPLG